MRKGIVGVYVIKHEDGNYYWSSYCVAGRISEHKSRLRRGKNQNTNLQEAFYKSGFAGLTFELLEECSKEELTEREGVYLRADDKAFNVLKFPKHTQGTLSSRISTTLKQLYKDSPEALEKARKGLAIGRACDAMKQNKHTVEANTQRGDSVAEDWANMSQDSKKQRSANISKGMKVKTVKQCNHCSEVFTGTNPRQKYCDPTCRIGAFNARHA